LVIVETASRRPDAPIGLHPEIVIGVATVRIPAGIDPATWQTVLRTLMAAT